MSKRSITKNEAIISLTVDPVVVKIVRALDGVSGVRAAFYLEQARWLTQHASKDTLEPRPSRESAIA